MAPLRPLPTPRFLVLVLAVASFALHALSTRAPIWNVDEAFTAVTAGEILDGGLPYRDAVDHRAPLTSYLYAAVLGLAGRFDMRSLHLVLAFVTFLTTLLVGRIGERVGGAWVGTTSAGLFLFMSTFSHPPLDLLAFHTEWPMALLESIGILGFLHAFEQPRRSAFFAAGLAFGLASLSKQPALLDLVAALGTVILLDTGRTVAGVTFASAGFLLPWILTTGYFFVHGALADFWFYVFVYNKDYYMAALPAGELTTQLVTSGTLMVKCAGMGLLVPLAVLAALARRARLAFVDLPFQLSGHLLVAAIAVSSFTAAVLPGRGFGHYFIQTFPSWSVAGALALHLLWGHFGEAGPGESMRPDRLRDRRILLVLLIFVPMSLLAARRVVSRYREYRDAVEMRRPSVEALVRHVRETTESSDRIFVWGFFSDLYVLTGRKPGARYSYCTFVTGLIPWVNGLVDQDTSRWAVPGSLDAMIADLEARKPLLIIDTSPGLLLHWVKYPPARFPAFQALLDRDYTREDAGPVVGNWFTVHRRIR